MYSGQTLNQNNGEEYLFLSFDAADTSGFDYSTFTFRLIDKDGNYNYDEQSIYTYVSPWNDLVSGGTKYEGSYLGIIDIEPEIKEGTYVLSSFNISDEANNDSSFSASTSSSNGVVTRSWSEEATDALGGIDLSTLSFTVSVNIVLKRVTPVYP